MPLWIVALVFVSELQAFSLIPWRRVPPEEIIEEAIRKDLDQGKLKLVRWSLSYKIVRRHTRKIDGEKYYYCDYKATAEVTLGNNWIKPGETSEHKGTVILFKRDKKWFRVILQ